MSDNLSQFGKHFQELLMKGLMTDEKWASQMEEVFKPDYFELKYLQYLSEKYFQYSKKYRLFPSLQLLVTIIKDDLKAKVGSDEVLCSQIIDYLKRMQASSDLSDLPFVKDKSLEWCRKQALRQALENAVDQMQENKYETIVEDIKKATMVGTTPSIGHDFSQELEARFIPQQRNPIPTGIPELDRKDILNGGVGKGELAVITASTGVGKSHFLVMIGAEALKRKKNVVHYTLELSETLVGNRYDSYFCEIDASDLLEHKNEVIEKYKELEIGRLIIKQYPMNSATVHTINSHLEKLALKGIKVDMVIVDYADKMRSTRQYDALRHELTLIYEELRSLAVELAIPVWTASQANRDGANAEIIDVTNMGESLGKAQTADIILGLSRMVHEKAMGVGRIYIAKNRAGRDGIVYGIGIDTAQSRFVVNGGEQLPEQVKSEDEKEMKKRLKMKWDQLKKEEMLS